MSIHRDTDAELRFHFQARIEALVEQGLSREDAVRRAHEEFGDVDAVREALRAIDRRLARRRSRLEFFESLWQDLAYAARSLRRTPVLALTIVVTLALGLGVNAAMFSLLDVIFVRPPAGVADPSGVRTIWYQAQFGAGARFAAGFDYASYLTVAKTLAGDADVTLFRQPIDRKVGHGEHAPIVTISIVAGNYFPFLGIRAQRGRLFSLDEDRVNDPRMVAVISDAFWERQFDRASDAVGAQLEIANEKYTIVGVAPRGFAGTQLNATDVWVPTSTLVRTAPPSKVPWWQNSAVNGFLIAVRPRAGVREVDLAARITAALRSETGSLGIDGHTVATLGSINYAMGPATLPPAFRVATRLAGVAIVVLLIACANVVNLLLARAARRRREIAVRIALGVSRGRLMRMLIAESVLLSLVATAAALGAAAWGGAAIRALLAPEIHFASAPMHWRVAAFAFGLAIMAGGIAGLAPALQSSASDVAGALKASALDRASRGSRLRNGLVAIQAALSVVLLVGALLFVQSLRNAQTHDVGFAVDQVVFGAVSFDTRDSLRDKAFPTRLRALERKLAAFPAVGSVAFTSMPPRAGLHQQDYTPDFDTTGRRLPVGWTIVVSPNYFATIGTRLLRGRTFTDAGPNSPLEMIVDQTMADALWPNDDPLRHCVYFPKTKSTCVPIVGVAQSTQDEMLTDKLQPHFYFSLDNPPVPTWGAAASVLRVSPNQRASVARALHDLLASEFPGGIPTIRTMAALMEPTYRPWRLGAELFTLFGVLALVVAGIGIYSSVSYAVSQRTHEFGIRVALGARTADVMRQVVSEGLRTVLLGVITGILMALAASRLVASLLYGIAPSDPATLVAVAIVLVAIAAAAAFVPAWRAAKADPVAALRAD
jgi:predicted permease